MSLLRQHFQQLLKNIYQYNQTNYIHYQQNNSIHYQQSNYIHYSHFNLYISKFIMKFSLAVSLFAAFAALAQSSFILRQERGICLAGADNTQCPQNAKRVCVYKQGQGVKFYDNSCQACRDIQHPEHIGNISPDHFHDFLIIWEQTDQYLDKCDQLKPIGPLN